MRLGTAVWLAGFAFRARRTHRNWGPSVGHFEGCTDPKMRNFTDFAPWVREQRDALAGKDVMMYCTGGIRCMKASAFLAEQGIENVYQLAGGIHRYMESIEPHESLFVVALAAFVPLSTCSRSTCGAARWRGKLFVFDERRVVGPRDVRVDSTDKPVDCGDDDVVGRCQLCCAPHEAFADDRYVWSPVSFAWRLLTLCAAGVRAVASCCWCATHASQSMLAPSIVRNMSGWGEVWWSYKSWNLSCSESWRIKRRYSQPPVNRVVGCQV